MQDLNCMAHNLKKDLKDATLRWQAADRALRHARRGIGVLYEINVDDLPYIKSRLLFYGLVWKRKGEMAVVWDPEVLEMFAFRYKEISPGGYVGRDGVKGRGDDRRVGPTRFAIKWLGYAKTDRTPIQVIGIHKVAKAFTSEGWRRALWWRSTRKTGRYIRRSLKRFPNGFIVGDENADFPVDYPFVQEVHVKTPSTFGRAHYDQLKVFGDLTVLDLQEFKTPSDHDGLRWRLRKIFGKLG